MSLVQRLQDVQWCGRPGPASAGTMRWGAPVRGKPPFRRSREDRMIAGVCGGIAKWGSWNPVWVRVIFVVGSILPILPGFLVYLLLWLVVPSEAARPGRAASRAS